MAQTGKRQCSSCGTAGMVYCHRTIERNFEGTVIAVPDVEGGVCTSCGELEFDTRESAERFFEQVVVLQQQERSKAQRRDAETQRR